MFTPIVGKVAQPFRAFLFGTGGIGKTYLCSCAKDVLIIDAERGAHQFECPKLAANTMNDLRDIFAWVIKETAYSTIVIDSATKVEKFLVDEILAENKWPNLEKPGFGKGFQVLKQEWINFLKGLDYLTKHGKNVVLIGHARVKTFADPMHEVYDRYEPEIEKSVMPYLVANFDAVLFYRWKVNVRDGDKDRNLAVGAGIRELYTAERPAFIAKNRYGLPDVITNPTAEIFERMK